MIKLIALIIPVGSGLFGSLWSSEKAKLFFADKEVEVKISDLSRVPQSVIDQVARVDNYVVGTKMAYFVCLNRVNRNYGHVTVERSVWENAIGRFGDVDQLKLQLCGALLTAANAAVTRESLANLDTATTLNHRQYRLDVNADQKYVKLIPFDDGCKGLFLRVPGLGSGQAGELAWDLPNRIENPPCIRQAREEKRDKVNCRWANHIGITTVPYPDTSMCNEAMAYIARNPDLDALVYPPAAGPYITVSFGDFVGLKVLMKEVEGLTNFSQEWRLVHLNSETIECRDQSNELIGTVTVPIGANMGSVPLVCEVVRQWKGADGVNKQVKAHNN